MTLELLWFGIIVFFWLGYLFLEGFDFGVGMLLPWLAKDDRERRVMINTIGPVWDGNEVWLIVAGGAMFAAFPGWYASLFSSVYLPLLVVLLALIGRGVAFEYRGKVNSVRWRKNWDRIIVAGSWIPPLGVGFIVTTTVIGLPLDAVGNRVGSVFSVFSWEALLGALAIAGFSLVHGATFLSLKTAGDIRDRAHRWAVAILPFALLPLLTVVVIVQVRFGSSWTVVGLALFIAAAIVAWWRLKSGREGQAFGSLGIVLLSAIIVLFGSLYPNVLQSTVDSAYNLSIVETAASPYALTVMSWVALFGAPAVLVYQGWTYWVFRKRISTSHIPEIHAP